MNFFSRIATASVTMAIVFGASARPLFAQRTVTTPRILQPVPIAEAKPVGKWFLKLETSEIALDLAADGTAKYDFKIGDKAYSLNAKLKDGELRIDYGNGMFMIYNAKLRDNKLVLTAGNLKENEEWQFAGVNVDPPVVDPAPKPKLVAPASGPPRTEPKGEKGLHDAPRGPTPEPTPPKDGEAPTEAFLIKLIQHRMEGNSGGVTYLMEVNSYKVGPARAAAPTETQPYATNSKVIPVSVKWTYKAYGQSSTAIAENENRFICWQTDTGEWRAGSVESKSGPIKSINK